MLFYGAALMRISWHLLPDGELPQERFQKADLGALTKCGWCPISSWNLSKQQQGLAELHCQFFPHFQLPQALVQWHRPALTWTTWAETQLIYLCVYSIGSDIWSRHPERAAFKAQFIWSILDVCFLISHLQCLFLPCDNIGSLQGLVQTRHVQMEPSGGRACFQPFSWSFAKGLLWPGVSDS